MIIIFWILAVPLTIFNAFFYWDHMLNAKQVPMNSRPGVFQYELFQMAEVFGALGHAIVPILGLLFFGFKGSLIVLAAFVGTSVLTALLLFLLVKAQPDNQEHTS